VSGLPDEPHDVAELLARSYEEVLELDERVHVVRDRLRARLYALKVATDPSLAQRIAEAEQLGDEGALAADDLVARLRARLAGG
jgi:hypothetical protein